MTVAIHTLHVLPESELQGVSDRLLNTVASNAAHALHRCHRALELDGSAHDYSSSKWLPVVYDIASSLLASARPNDAPVDRASSAGCD